MSHRRNRRARSRARARRGSTRARRALSRRSAPAVIASRGDGALARRPPRPSASRRRRAARPSFQLSSPRCGRSPRRAAFRGETFDAAFDGVTFDPRVSPTPRRRPNSSSRSGTISTRAVRPERIEQRPRRRRGACTPGSPRPRTTYGVDRSVVIGIWGHGDAILARFAGSDDVIRSLASLAFVHFRGDYFRDELLARAADSGGGRHRARRR